jgi:hypothetical protein
VVVREECVERRPHDPGGAPHCCSELC